MSNSKTVELLLQRKLVLMQEIAEIDRALKVITSDDTLQISDFYNEEFREEERQKMKEEINNDLDGNPMYQIGHGRGDD